MAASKISVLVLATALQFAYAIYDTEVCKPFRQSFGLIPPPLPRNFELKGENVDHNLHYTTYHEIYLDFSENRAKYLYMLNGIEHHLLFDYDTRQVVKYDIMHPGENIKDDPMSHACVAEEIEDSEHRDLFGFLDDYSNWPKMYDATQTLRFGGQYQYAFNGTNRMNQRGMVVDLFRGCVYDQQIDATMKAEYFFTNEIVSPSGGNSMERVTGFTDGVLSVPAKATFDGVMYDITTKTKLAFNKTENVFWFVGEPDFALDTFRIPRYMYCDNYRGRKDMDPFPVAFTARVQKTNIMRDTLGQLTAKEETAYEDIMYHQGRELARRDFTPNPVLDTEIKNMFQSTDPVKMIFDFNTGVAYVTQKGSGRCYARPIIHGDFFEANADTPFIEMAGPDQVFQMQHDEMEYKGTDLARDIECDVFVGKYFDKHLNATYHKETYITTNGWHEESDQYLEYGVPVKHTVIARELNGEFAEAATAYQFFKFIAGKPPLTDFDVDECIEAFERKDFAILLSVSKEEKKIIFDYKSQFLEAAQYYLTDVTQVETPLRVQRMNLRQVSAADARTHLLFTLVGKAKLKTKVPVGQPGLTLNEATQTLLQFIDQNQFAVKFTPPKATQPTIIKALQGALYVRMGDGELESPTLFHTTDSGSDDVQYDDEPLSDDPKNVGKQDHNGMSSGNLALLAFGMLFIGLGIGMALMYLYRRYHSENSLEDRITLTPQTSVTVESRLDTVEEEH